MTDDFHKKKNLRRELWKLRIENAMLRKHLKFMKAMLDLVIFCKYRVRELGK